jgi:hypothetical protein
MRASFRARPDLEITVDGETQRDLFRELSHAAEVFGETACGLCGDTAIVPVTRTVGKMEFHEWACRGCDARLSMGCLMEGGGLFPHRKLAGNGKPDREHGSAGEHHGWSHFKGDTAVEPAAPAAAPAKAVAAKAAPAKAAASVQPPRTPQPEAVKPGAASTITEEQWQAIQAEALRKGLTPAVLLEHIGVKHPRQILSAVYAEVLGMARNPDKKLMQRQRAKGVS